MRTLFAVALSAFALVVASLPAHAQTSVADVERYLNSIRTFKARFVQSNPNGSIVQGNL
jgi:outer membrane lipoprotein-sorting protein